MILFELMQTWKATVGGNWSTKGQIDRERGREKRRWTPTEPNDIGKELDPKEDKVKICRKNYTFDEAS